MKTVEGARDRAWSSGHTRVFVLVFDLRQFRGRIRYRHEVRWFDELGGLQSGGADVSVGQVHRHGYSFAAMYRSPP